MGLLVGYWQGILCLDTAAKKIERQHGREKLGYMDLIGCWLRQIECDLS